MIYINWYINFTGSTSGGKPMLFGAEDWVVMSDKHNCLADSEIEGGGKLNRVRDDGSPVEKGIGASMDSCTGGCAP